MNVRRCSTRVRRTICFEQLLKRLLFVAFFLLVPSVAALPASNAKAIDARRKVSKPDDAPFDDGLQNYLVDFGYLPMDNPEISNLRTDDVIRKAIGRMQDFAGLERTGFLDEPTKELLQTKRCGLPDVNFDESRRRHRRYSVHSSKWLTSALTYKVENYPHDLDLSRTRRVLYDAFEVWRGASSVTFTEVGIDSEADIIMKFGSRYHNDSYPFDGPNVVLAHAFFPSKGLGGDIHFDNDEKWTDRPLENKNAINLLATAAHEIGHSLGLGHSKVHDSLMFPYYKSGQDEIKLSFDDFKGVQELYGIGTLGRPTTVEPMSTTTRFWMTNRNDEKSADPVTESPIVSSTTPMPQPCDSHVDAISRLRSETFVFKGKYHWRFDEHGNLNEAPSETVRFFVGLPQNLTKVDAVFERLDTIIFFIGRLFYEFRAQYATGLKMVGEPRDISELGLENDVHSVDAAFVWEYNGGSYVFAGDKYWRIDDKSNKVYPGYPREISSVWISVPNNIDAVFSDKKGTTYFVKGDQIYKFNDFFMKVEKTFPRRINNLWEHCSNKDQEVAHLSVNTQPKSCSVSLTMLFLVVTICRFIGAS